MNYYIVTFDRKTDVSYKRFHADFVAHSGFIRWFHYIQSSYIIGTNMEAEEVSKHFYATAKQYNLPTTHLVVQVSLRERFGRLTEDAWNWLKRNTSG